MRSYIRHILLLPGYDHAFNDGGNIALFGNTPKSMSVMVHEIGHSLTAEAYGGDGNFHGKLILSFPSTPLPSEFYFQSDASSPMLSLTQISLPISVNNY